MKAHLSLQIILTLLLLGTVYAEQDDLHFKISAKLTQCIGTFSTYGHVHVNDEFILDSRNLPKNQLAFTRPNFAPERDVSPYIPFGGEDLKISRIQKYDWGSGGQSLQINLSTGVEKSHSALRIQISSLLINLKPGSKVKIKILEESDDDIGGMAEAIGEIIE